MLDASCDQQPGPDDITVSVITCPHCGHQQTETMPVHSCAIFYHCPGCAAVLRPLEGDCCVYCSYGTVPCVAVQRGRRAEDGRREV